MNPTSHRAQNVRDDRSGHPFRLLVPHYRLVAAGLVFLLLTNALAQFIPWIIKKAIDAISSNPDDGTFILMILGVITMALFQAPVRILSRIFIFNAGRNAEYELRNEVFSRLTRLDSRFYRRYRTGDLVSRLTNDLAAVRALYGAGVLHIGNTLFAYTMAIPLMCGIDPWLTLWSLLPYPALLFGARAFSRGVYQRSQELQTALATMSAGVEEDLAGIRALKTNCIEEIRTGLFTNASTSYLHQAISLARWRAALMPIIGLGAGSSLVIVLWVGGQRVIEGALTLGSLVAFTLYIGLLAWPTISIGWILSLWQRGMASWDRLAGILTERSPLEHTADVTAQQPSSPSVPELEFRGLSLAIDGHPVLHQINLKILHGTICGIVGPVGCGKTTLAEVAARLVDVPPGTFFINGQDATLQTTRWARDQITYAPQNVFLFSATIRQNIAYGLSPSSDPDSAKMRRLVERAAHIAGLDPDLASFPQGIDTMVGERGLSLSGGQRQRVALARALVSDRPLLILDDSLSAVDADTEQRILKRLSQTLASRLTLLISHRLSALQHSHQILVLERGRAVETGTHQELLGANGLYSKLYHRQLLLKDLES